MGTPFEELEITFTSFNLMPDIIHRKKVLLFPFPSDATSIKRPLSIPFFDR